MTARPRFLTTTLLVALALASAGAGCDSETVDRTSPLFTVAEVVEEGHEGLISVSGFLFVDPAREVRLCDAMAESYPPQCGGPFLVVEGIDLSEYDLEEAQGVRWSADGVVVVGDVRGETLVADETPS